MKEDKKCYGHGNRSSSGELEIRLTFMGKPWSKSEKEEQLARHLAANKEDMFNNGYLNISTAEYGNSKEYWKKLIDKGLIEYVETSSFTIKLEIWIEGYLQKEKDLNKYVKHMNEIRERIIDKQKTKTKYNDKLECTKCKKQEFNYYYNEGTRITGTCNNCNFRVLTHNPASYEKHLL